MTKDARSHSNAPTRLETDNKMFNYGLISSYGGDISVICTVQSETRLDRLKALYLSTYHLDITNGSHAQRTA